MVEPQFQSIKLLILFENVSQAKFAIQGIEIGYIIKLVKASKLQIITFMLNIQYIYDKTGASEKYFEDSVLTQRQIKNSK